MSVLGPIVKSPLTGAIGAIVTSLWEALWFMGPLLGYDTRDRSVYLVVGWIAFVGFAIQAFVTRLMRETAMKEALDGRIEVLEKHLAPTFALDGEFFIQKTNVNDDGREWRTYVQIMPKCLTPFADVPGCRGRLISVKKWSDQIGDWEPTDLNESLLLEWSNEGSAPLTLRNSVPQRLNVCWANNLGTIIPDVPLAKFPTRCLSVLNLKDRFQFLINVSASGSKSASALVEVSFNNQWDAPTVSVKPLSVTQAP